MAPTPKYAPLQRNRRVGAGASSLESVMKRSVANSDILSQVQSKLSSTQTIDTLAGTMRIPMFAKCGQAVMYRHAVFAGRLVTALTEPGSVLRTHITNVVPTEFVNDQVNRVISSCFGIILEAASSGVMTSMDGFRDILSPHQLPFDHTLQVPQQIVNWARLLFVEDATIKKVGTVCAAIGDNVLPMAFLKEYGKLALAISTVSRTAKTMSTGSNKLTSLSRVAGIELGEGYPRTSMAVQYGISSLFQFGSEFIILLTYMSQNSNDQVSRVSNFVLGYLADRGNWVIKSAINLLIIGKHPVVTLRELEPEVRAIIEIGEKAAALPGGLEYYSITVEGMQGRGFSTLSKVTRNLGGIKYALNELFPQVTKMKRAFSTDGEIFSDALIEKIAAFQGSQKGTTAVGAKVLGSVDANDQVDYLTHALAQLTDIPDEDEEASLTPEEEED